MSSRENSAVGRAWHSHNVGRDDTAIAEFRKVLASSPDDVDVLYGLGMALRGAGQLGEAEEVFEKVLAHLRQQTASDEGEANRLEMLRRMTQQQLEFIKG